jgi:predicted extracellular nuclease
MSKRITILPLFIIITLFILSLFSAPGLVRSAVNHIVISEIQISGDGGANDEFIELYNPTNSAIDISGWSIQRETITGSFSKKNFVTPANIPAYGYYLIANTAFNDATLTPDLSHSSFTLSSTGATIFLVNDHTLLTTGDVINYCG